MTHPTGTLTYRNYWWWPCGSGACVCDVCSGRDFASDTRPTGNGGPFLCLANLSAPMGQERRMEHDRPHRNDRRDRPGPLPPQDPRGPDDAGARLPLVSTFASARTPSSWSPWSRRGAGAVFFPGLCPTETFEAGDAAALAPGRPTFRWVARPLRPPGLADSSRPRSAPVPCPFWAAPWAGWISPASAFAEPVTGRFCSPARGRLGPSSASSRQASSLIISGKRHGLYRFSRPRRGEATTRRFPEDMEERLAAPCAGSSRLPRGCRSRP